MNNIIANIRTQLQKLKCRITNLTKRVNYIEDNCCNGGGGGVQSIVPGDNISVDNTDPQNPVVSSTGGVTSVAMTAPTGFTVGGSPITSTGTFALNYAAGYTGYTTAEKSKLAGIEAGAQANIPETDPTVPNHVKAITNTQVSNWDNAYSWGNHNLMGYATETWSDSRFEPIFTKNTAFNKNFGNESNTVAEGNHTHNYNELQGTPPATEWGDIVGDIADQTDLMTQLDNKLDEPPSDGLFLVEKSGTGVNYVNAGLTTTDTNDIEFTGDGTPANPLSAIVGNKIPYKAIDTSVTEPDLAQLNAHGTDRVDFPNLDRIYFLNGAKWTYVETIDL